MRTYSKFKTVYEYEPYLEIANFETRKCISRFRLSNHTLMIEIGRHKKLAVDQRLCTTCKEIEDEEHFLTTCKKNENLRISLFKFITESCPNFTELENEEKMIYLLTASNPEITGKVCTFIKNSFSLMS